MAAADKELNELDQVALDIFSRQAHPGRAKQDAALAYRMAADFLETRDRVRKGEMKTEAPKGPQLADVSSPNMPRTHPLNLVAQNYVSRKDPTVAHKGDLAKVNRIMKWLGSHPTPTEDDEKQAFLRSLSREFPDLHCADADGRDVPGWDLPTIALAREIFPTYALAAN